MIDTLRSLITRLVGADRSLRRIVSNSGWLAGGSTLAKVLKIVESVLVARLLGVEQFGQLALIVAFSATVSQFVDSRVWETAIKFIAGFRAAAAADKASATAKLCYLIDAISAGLVFIVLFLSAGLAAQVFAKSIALAPLMQLYAASVLINIPNGTASAILRLDNRFDLLAYQKLISAMVSLTGVAAVALLGGSLREILWAYLASMAAGIVALVLWSHRSAGNLGMVRWSRAPLRSLRGELRPILRFAAYSNLGATSRLVTKRADILILGFFSLPVEVGWYKLARTLADPLAVAFNPLYTAIYPELARLASEGRMTQIRELQRKLSFGIGVLIVPVGIAVTMGARWFIVPVFGQAYAGAIVLVQIMVWQIIWTPMIWFPGYMLAIGRERRIAAMNWLDSIIYLALLLALAPPWGATGAATATLLRFVIWTVMAIVVYQRLAHRPGVVETVRR